MKFPESLLREFVTTSLTAEGLGDLLTMAGFELEGIEEVEGESVLDIKVVSNRGDGLSVLGLAREVLAKDSEAKPTDLYTRSANRFPDAKGRHQNKRADLVTVECSEGTRYGCYVVEGIENGESPEWIQKRIRQAGWRPISLLVDLTNYVMLEQGQPLHAFDLGLLKGERIVVRHARPGEKLQTLNGDEHELQAGQMMICDAERPIAAAGIMGGLATEVSATTTRALLESAHFLNTSVRKTRRQLGLSTEASYRFERSVDPEGVVAALDRLLDLLLQVQPNIKVTDFADIYPTKPTPKQLHISPKRASRLLGMEISQSQAKHYLERLGMTVTESGEDLSVTAPSWRPDLVREEDLVEELGRVHGYEKIPAVLPQGSSLLGGVSGYEAFVDRIREEAVRVGLSQTISHSLRDVHVLDRNANRVGPRNPNSPEMAHLRNSVLPSLADAAKRNGGRDLQLFEIGRTFDTCDEGHLEQIHLGLLCQGLSSPLDWLEKKSSNESFFTAKAMLDQIFRAGRLALRFEQPKELDSRLHPTRQAVVSVGDRPFGVLGQIHPDYADQLDLPADTILAELSLAHAYDAVTDTLHLTTVSRHPAVRRDLAVLVDQTVPYEKLATAISTAVGAVLERQWLFDVYTGQGIPEGKHSLGIALQLRKPDATFTDEEANQVRERAVQAIGSLGATTR